MKSVSIDELKAVEENTIKELLQIFPGLRIKVAEIQDTASLIERENAISSFKVYAINLISCYRIFMDQLGKSNDFEVFFQEIYLRRMEELKLQLPDLKLDSKFAIPEIINGKNLELPSIEDEEEYPDSEAH